MRQDIHPEYQQVAINCLCGNTILTGTTDSSFGVEICSACHPFYTGTQKILDAQGRIEKFNKRYNATKA